MITTAPPVPWNRSLVYGLLRALLPRFPAYDKQHALTNTPLRQPSAIQQPVAAALMWELGR